MEACLELLMMHYNFDVEFLWLQHQQSVEDKQRRLMPDSPTEILIVIAP